MCSEQAFSPDDSKFSGVRLVGAIVGVCRCPAQHHPIWPVVIIGFGLSLTAGWIVLLRYGLIKIVEYTL
jgi:hypothetical protein